MPEAAAPRVFISYSHDNPEHRDRVLELADRLCADGIDASIDQYVQFPSEGWPVWCEAEIEKANFVLMVCTETYLRPTLWYISDLASGDLVTDFYRGLQSGGQSKAQALRAAQRALAGDPRFAHPAYWAPFLLIGDWL